MKLTSISSQDLLSQKKYNSFVLCQTTSIPLSQKFPFVVTTLKGKICVPVQNQESCQQFEYNYSFDCINYQINGKHVILGQGKWIKFLLTAKENNLLQTYQIINYEPLQIKKDVKFYFYHQKRKIFILLLPKYLIMEDCIVFQDIQHIQDIQYKHLNLSQIDALFQFIKGNKKYFDNFIYSFRCEYGIISDIHFMGSFVRGFKPISSYLKKDKNNQYIHFIDQNLFKNISRLYPFSNL